MHTQMRTVIQLLSIVQVDLTAAGMKVWKRHRKATGLDPHGHDPTTGYMRVNRLTICLGELMRIFGPVAADQPFEGAAVTLVPDEVLPAELRQHR